FVLPLVAFAACRCSPRSTRQADPPASSTASTNTAALKATAVSSPTPRDPSCPRELTDARRDGTKPNSYIEPTEQERAVLSQAIARLAQGQQAEGLDAIGFEVVRPSAWSDVVLLREKGRLRGGGAYAIRTPSPSSLLVGAPHTFFDEGTL